MDTEVQPVLDLERDDGLNSSDKPHHSDDEKTECLEDTIASKEDEIMEILRQEEEKFEMLEMKRKNLEQDIGNLLSELVQEKILFRQAIDTEIARRNELENKINEELTSLNNKNRFRIDPLENNAEEIETKLKDYRETNKQSKLSRDDFEKDADIERIKSNLEVYKKASQGSIFDKRNKQRRRAAARTFQKHLEEVGTQCAERMEKLEKIQKSIENIQFAGSEMARNNFGA